MQEIKYFSKNDKGFSIENISKLTDGRKRKYFFTLPNGKKGEVILESYTESGDNYMKYKIFLEGDKITHMNYFDSIIEIRGEIKTELEKLGFKDLQKEIKKIKKNVLNLGEKTVLKENKKENDKRKKESLLARSNRSDYLFEKLEKEENSIGILKTIGLKTTAPFNLGLGFLAIAGGPILGITAMTILGLKGVSLMSSLIVLKKYPSGFDKRGLEAKSYENEQKDMISLIKYNLLEEVNTSSIEDSKFYEIEKEANTIEKIIFLKVTTLDSMTLGSFIITGLDDRKEEVKAMFKRNLNKILKNKNLPILK